MSSIAKFVATRKLVFREPGATHGTFEATVPHPAQAVVMRAKLAYDVRASFKNSSGPTRTFDLDVAVPSVEGALAQLDELVRAQTLAHLRANPLLRQEDKTQLDAYGVRVDLVRTHPGDAPATLKVRIKGWGAHHDEVRGVWTPRPATWLPGLPVSGRDTRFFLYASSDAEHELIDRVVGPLGVASDVRLVGPQDATAGAMLTMLLSIESVSCPPSAPKDRGAARVAYVSITALEVFVRPQAYAPPSLLGLVGGALFEED